MNKRKTIICSFILLSRILQYVCTTIGLNIYLPGYLQFGAITKKAGIYKIFFFLVDVSFHFSEMIAKSTITGSCNTCVFNFIRNKLFSRAVVPSYFPTNNEWLIQFLDFLTSI